MNKAHEHAWRDAGVELERALGLFPEPEHSAHEGLAVLEEEVAELRAHVYTNQKRRDTPAMRKEAIQAAAMAIRFAAEVASPEQGGDVR